MWKIHVSPNADGVMPTYHGEDVDAMGPKLAAAIVAAGWTDDPGTGRAIILDDGSELLNPVPVAPPLGYIQEVSVIDRLHQELDARRRILAEDAIFETEEDAADFDTGPDYEDPFSRYEILPVIPEAPAIPTPAPIDVPAPAPIEVPPVPPVPPGAPVDVPLRP